MTQVHTPLLSETELRHAAQRAGMQRRDSSQTLLGLMRLARSSEDAGQSPPGGGSLDGIIAKNTLRSLLSALHFRDLAAIRHSRRVALLAVGLAQHLGWEGRALKSLEVAALLHDIGKIGVPENILFKPAKLSPDELELMSLHANVGLAVLQACCAHADVLEIVAHSQNAYANFEGPAGVGRGAALQGARILAVADAFESLSTDQPYRPARGHQEVLQILEQASGKQFDGNIVHALARYIEKSGLPFAEHVEELELSLKQRGAWLPQEVLEAVELSRIFSYLYVLENLYDGFLIVDSDLRLRVWSRGLESLIGYPSREMLGKTWTSRLLAYCDAQGQPLPEPECLMHRVVQAHNAVAAEMHVPRRDGRRLHVELQTIPIVDYEGRLQGVIEIFRDLTRTGGRRPREFRELKLAATRDALTALANRGELETQLTSLISAFAENSDEPFSVIFVDADHFKNVNDTYGHAVGDQVLVDLARLLREETYSGEIVGRYGGEEFVILCPGTDLEQAFRRAERLRTSIRSSRIGGIDRLRMTASFGVAEAEPGDSVESLLRRADKALYEAKQSGRDRTCSLTSEQLLDEVSLQGESPSADNPFMYTARFNVVVAANMLVYKLAGYVDDRQATLVKVAADRVVIHYGSLGLWPYWGRQPCRQPVELEFLIGDSPARNHISARKQIVVRIRPLGRVRSASAFQRRARAVVHELKQYFAAE